MKVIEKVPNKVIIMNKKKRIGLIAHDNKKKEMLEWVKHNKDILLQHTLFATESTGRLIERALKIKITKFQSGPLGGDQQIGAQIVQGTVDFLIFLWDPLESHPHDPDVKALLRMAVVWNIPMACNRSTADFIITSPSMMNKYTRKLPAYGQYRQIKKNLLIHDS